MLLNCTLKNCSVGKIYVMWFFTIKTFKKIINKTKGNTVLLASLGNHSYEKSLRTLWLPKAGLVALHLIKATLR